MNDATPFSPFSRDWSGTAQNDPPSLHALRVEGRDAAASTRTAYTMAVGDSFNGSLGVGDEDWVRVQLQPGTYVISLDTRGSGGVYDPFLQVMNSGGGLVAFDDDGGSRGLNSRLVLNITQAGTYYLSAGSYADSYTGDYSLSLSRGASLRNFTMPEIAAQLTDGYWRDGGGARRAFDVGQGGVLNVDLSGLTAEGRALAEAALSSWEAVTGIRFNRNPGPNATIHITFDDSDNGAYSGSTTLGGTILSSHVNVGMDWLNAYGTGFNSYSYQTYIHEIGHALGLGHAGNYNGSATYGVDNHYLNDSWQASVMSYFSQTDNTSINASYAYITSAMIADILAVQALYGPTSIRTGDNTYGEQTNAGAAYARIAAMLRNPNSRDDIAFTVFDQGGIDTLDLSGDNTNQRINLSQGSISSAYGLIGNISIASGTVIEHYRAGRGHDVVNGNTVNNDIYGGAGNDTLRGNGGHDRLFGGAGADLLEGGIGNDRYYLDSTADRVVEAAGAGIDTVFAPFTTTLGANLENLVLTSVGAQDGTGNGLANQLTGNAAGNRLQGLDGADTLRGEGGADTLEGGNGNDLLNGGFGRDLLIGGNDNDIYVSDGNDEIRESAGQGIDTVRALVSMTLGANLENLELVGPGAQDGTGNALANRLNGNGFANRLRGLAGDDIFYAAGGNDTLEGGAGRDTLHGGIGDDLLVGGVGDDLLNGGLGADHFAFHAGRDVVQDFQDNVDTLRIDDALWGGGARTAAQVLAYATVVGGNAVFDFGAGNVLTVNGVGDLNALRDDLIVI